MDEFLGNLPVGGESPDTPDYVTDRVNTQHQVPVDDVEAELLEITPHKDNDGIDAGVNLLQSLHDVRIRDGENLSNTHSFEVWFDRGEFKFVVGTANKKSQERFQRRISNLYNDSEVNTIDGSGKAFPTLDRGFYRSAGVLEEKLHTFIPLKNKKAEGFDVAGDPYIDILGEMATLDSSVCVLQVIFRPASPNWTTNGPDGRSVYDIAEEFREGEMESLLDINTWTPGHEIEQREPTKAEKEAAKIIEERRGVSGFHCNIRFLTASPDKNEALERAMGIGSMFAKYYNTKTEQGLQARAVDKEDISTQVSYMIDRDWVDREMILSINELAGVAHIPNQDIQVPGIQWRQSQTGTDVPSKANKETGDEDDPIANAPTEEGGEENNNSFANATNFASADVGSTRGATSSGGNADSQQTTTPEQSQPTSTDPNSTSTPEGNSDIGTTTSNPPTDSSTSPQPESESNTPMPSNSSQTRPLDAPIECKHCGDYRIEPVSGGVDEWLCHVCEGTFNAPRPTANSILPETVTKDTPARRLYHRPPTDPEMFDDPEEVDDSGGLLTSLNPLSGGDNTKDTSYTAPRAEIYEEVVAAIGDNLIETRVKGEGPFPPETVLRQAIHSRVAQHLGDDVESQPGEVAVYNYVLNQAPHDELSSRRELNAQYDLTPLPGASDDQQITPDSQPTTDNEPTQSSTGEVKTETDTTTSATDDESDRDGQEVNDVPTGDNSAWEPDAESESDVETPDGTEQTSATTPSPEDDSASLEDDTDVNEGGSTSNSESSEQDTEPHTKPSQTSDGVVESEDDGGISIEMESDDVAATQPPLDDTNEESKTTPTAVDPDIEMEFGTGSDPQNQPSQSESSTHTPDTSPDGDNPGSESSEMESKMSDSEDTEDSKDEHTDPSSSREYDATTTVKDEEESSLTDSTEDPTEPTSEELSGNTPQHPDTADITPVEDEGENIDQQPPNHQEESGSESEGRDSRPQESVSVDDQPQEDGRDVQPRGDPSTESVVEDSNTASTQEVEKEAKEPSPETIKTSHLTVLAAGDTPPKNTSLFTRPPREWINQGGSNRYNSPAPVNEAVAQAIAVAINTTYDLDTVKQWQINKTVDELTPVNLSNPAVEPPATAAVGEKLNQLYDPGENGQRFNTSQAPYEFVVPNEFDSPIHPPAESNKTNDMLASLYTTQELTQQEKPEKEGSDPMEVLKTHYTANTAHSLADEYRHDPFAPEESYVGSADRDLEVSTSNSDSTNGRVGSTSTPHRQQSADTTTDAQSATHRSETADRMETASEHPTATSETSDLTDRMEQDNDNIPINEGTSPDRDDDTDTNPSGAGSLLGKFSGALDRHKESITKSTSSEKSETESGGNDTNTTHPPSDNSETEESNTNPESTLSREEVQEPDQCTHCGNEYDFDYLVKIEEWHCTECGRTFKSTPKQDDDPNEEDGDTGLDILEGDEPAGIERAAQRGETSRRLEAQFVDLLTFCIPKTIRKERMEEVESPEDLFALVEELAAKDQLRDIEPILSGEVDWDDDADIEKVVSESSGEDPEDVNLPRDISAEDVKQLSEQIEEPAPDEDYTREGSIPAHLAHQLKDAEHMFESPTEAAQTETTDESAETPTANTDGGVKQATDDTSTEGKTDSDRKNMTGIDASDYDS